MTEPPLYDREEFYNAYLTLPRSQKGLDGAPEWPTLRSMVGSVTGQDILDLGCGLGWFARWAVESGATGIDASDISVKMIERAEELTPAEMKPKISFAIKDLNDIGLQEGVYNLAFSSLTLHYLSTESLRRLLGLIFASLKPGGRFVFSIEHPIYTAPSKPSPEKLHDGREVWPLDSYAKDGLRETNWLGGVKKHHRTMTTYLKELMGAGFVLSDFDEWMPSEEYTKKEPMWKFERDRPMFLLMKVVKPIVH
jgi:SAM-dependent methyltransferase